MAASPLTWTDASVTPPVEADFDFILDTDFRKQILVVHNDTEAEGYVNARIVNKSQYDTLAARSDVTELYWAPVFSGDTPLSPGYVEDDLVWENQATNPADSNDSGSVYGSSSENLLFIVFKRTSGRKRLVISTPAFAAAVLNLSFVTDVYWATAPTAGPLDADVFDLSYQRFVIAETVGGVETLSTIYTYANETAAQGYIDTFGGTRDLRIAHMAKLDSAAKPGDVLLWAVLRGGSQIGNMHASEAAANSWVSIFGQTGDEVVTVKELPENPVELEPAVFDHDSFRYHIIETVSGVESVLANWDYSSEAGAQGYIDTFGGTRDLRIGYFAKVELGTSDGGHQSFAVYNNSGTLVEVKLTLSAAQGYAGIFGYTDIRTLEETTEPS